MFQSLAHRLVLLWGWRRLSVAFLAGAASALAMAPIHFAPILFLTFPVLVFLLDGALSTGKRSLKRLTPAAAVGWWFGFGYFLAGLYWIGAAFLAEGNDALLPLMPLAVLAMAGGLALFPMLGCLAARLLWSPGPTRIVALAVGLGLSEWLRGHVLTGFPWNLFGQALAFSDVTAQAASVAGIYGLTFAGIFVFATPALFTTDSAKQPVIRILVLCSSLSLLAADIGYGLVRLNGAAPVGTAVVDGMHLRIVQPNINQGQKWSSEYRQATIDKLISLSDAKTGPETLGAMSFRQIIWPETALPFFLTEEPTALERIADLLSPGTVLTTGAPRLEPLDDGRKFYNSAYVIDDRGNILDAYDKVHLVPFGEYLPFATWFKAQGIDGLFKGIGGFSPGPARRVITPPGQPSFATLICYEAIFSGEILDETTPSRPDYLINLTNDGWYGRTSGPYQHLDQVRLRAIEEGLPIIRAANTGISAIIDGYGRTVAQLPLGTDGILDGMLPSEHPASLFTRNRSTFSLVFLASSLILLLVGMKKRKNDVDNFSF